MKRLVFFLLLTFTLLSFGCGNTCIFQASQNCYYAITYNTASTPGQLTLFAYPAQDFTITVNDCAGIVSSTVVAGTCFN